MLLDSASCPARKPKINEVLLAKDDALRCEESDEKRIRNEFVGRGDISLHSLKINSEVATPFNKSQVLGIKESLLERFDPSE